MSNTRVIVQDGALSRAARSGDTILNPVISTITADAIATITAAQIAGGVVQFTGLTAGRAFTTDTAVNILAAFTGMDVGDSISFLVSITTAFAGTWGAGAGVTLAGRATTPASSYSLIYITKTSATTVTWTVL
jgi:hypothetical protein